VSEAALAGAPPRPWSHPVFRWTLAGAVLAAATLWLAWTPISARLYDAEFAVARLLPEAWIAGAGWALLPGLAFLAGLLASLSPCVLPLVPLNVALIGAAEASGWRAAAISARFVFGAALALSVLGLAADLAGFLLIEQRGPVFVGAGLIMLYLGLAAIEITPLPWAGRAPGGVRKLGPAAAGAAFALITTPCASPLLAAVLAAAGSQGIPGLSAVSMLGFSLGYTGLVFLAGVFGGRLVQRLRRCSFEAPRAAAAALLLVAGAGFTAVGLRWF
jgi:cytochrome c-type biogenesis protein